MENEEGKALNKLAEFLLDNLQEGKELVLEQAPDVVRQWLAWELWSHVFLGILASILLLVCGISMKRLSHWLSKQEGTSEAEFVGFFGGTFFCIGGIACTIAVLVNCYTACHVAIAPKAYLMAYLIDAVK